MSEQNDLTIERQFILAKINRMIDDLTHEDLKAFTKDFYRHHLMFEQITQEIIKAQLVGEIIPPHID